MKLESITIIEQFQKMVEKRSGDSFITFEDESYTWAEMDALSDQLAVSLLYEKVERGSHVAICGDNSIGWICAFLAVLKVGATAVLINPRLREQESWKLLHLADAEYVFYDETFAVDKTTCLKERIIGRSIGNFQRKELEINPPVPQAEKDKLIERQRDRKPSDTACMLFTSGSTSIPKGVMLSHFQLINIAREATETMNWSALDRICLALPMFHCFGLSTGLLSSFVHGGSLYISSGRKSGAVMKCIEVHRCTVLNAVPSLFLAILYQEDRKNYNLSSLYSGIIAGSDVHREDYIRIYHELGMKGLRQSYGQTEASPSITFTHEEDRFEVKAGSVGRKISNMELKIQSLETEEEQGAFEKGEILIRGYNVMKGYYKNEEETKAVLSEDGWLKTGDIGYLDEAGNLYIYGRKKDIIIRCGENISPKEIEEAILANCSATQVKVFGIPAPVVQEEITACVETSHRELTTDIIRAALRTCLADYKIPRYLFLYDQFPMSTSGKVDIQALKRDAMALIYEA